MPWPNKHTYIYIYIDLEAMVGEDSGTILLSTASHLRSGTRCMRGGWTPTIQGPFEAVMCTVSTTVGDCRKAASLLGEIKGYPPLTCLRTSCGLTTLALLQQRLGVCRSVNVALLQVLCHRFPQSVEEEKSPLWSGNIPSHSAIKPISRLIKIYEECPSQIWTSRLTHIKHTIVMLPHTIVGGTVI